MLNFLKGDLKTKASLYSRVIIQGELKYFCERNSKVNFFWIRISSAFSVLWHQPFQRWLKSFHIFPVCGGRDVLYSSTLLFSISFMFWEVWQLHGVYRFLNCSGKFLVLMYLQKPTFSVRFLNYSWILTSWQNLVCSLRKPWKRSPFQDVEFRNFLSPSSQY